MAAIGCASTTQIPLTHRDHAHAVTFITGHRKNGEMHINWDLALQKDSTVVFIWAFQILKKSLRN